MVLQQKRLEANKVDDCKCFAHDKKTKCLRDKTFRPNFRQSILRKTMQKLPRRICWKIIDFVGHINYMPR